MNVEHLEYGDQGTGPADGRHCLMAVSLSSRSFSSRFAHCLGKYLADCRLNRLEILLGDSCEAMNYVVFRGLGRQDAVALAERRAFEIGAMFRRVLRLYPVDFTISRQSDWIGAHHDDMERARRALRFAYEAGGRFRTDVERQVWCNLSRHGDAQRIRFIAEHLEQLVTYVIEEVALFYVYRHRHPNCVELYPGEELFVKRRLWSGCYKDEVALPVGGLLQARFTDVSFLVEEDRRRAAG